MNEDDKIYLVLPISRIVGISLLIMTLMTGGTVRMVSKYHPAAAARAIAEEALPFSTACPPPINGCWNTRTCRAWSSSTEAHYA